MAEDRRCDEYWSWRRNVVLRDGHKCQWPSCRRRTRLEVHHISPWASCVSLRYDIGNGISLCKPHHYGIKGKEHNYAETFRLIIAQQKPQPSYKKKPRKRKPK